ncbi:3-deoxy-D-manno-octulosonic-acid transferase [Tenacibaculum sp. MAR_2009_124]|uniref:3-deoxy-D-manno-octulosonic acid transferase n=1 Tax=Tenacibaculum sp. MAR_2009_124 TaxID=1250059 RepID=UPI0008985780|nr:glycosyltransferase N-terminal domain-containing protein [Tenacibaculum sp. MAR_2009_124]SED23097.1 3-deoxy-D-manno-octulosonic-acid transferase [Tenacibaculum sp. MAR_2009_124]
MGFIYNIIVSFVYFIIKIIALFNKKLHLFVQGRKESFEKLSAINNSDKVLWFHAASLGEFEQARPIIENLRKDYSNYKIVVTFFSPSGYEIRKNYPYADVICYLPFDTKSNMKKFISSIQPELAFIIKYEFWPNLLDQLQKQQIKTILISGIFREKQSFFKWYGSYMRKKLRAFDFFFVQNDTSKDLLNSIGFNNVVKSGDTRFDRVYDILKQQNQLAFVEEFKNNTYTVIAGSTWPEDEELIIDYINNYASNDEKFIIAPHTIQADKIQTLKSSISKNTILFSEKDNVDLKAFQVLIIDTIGILTKIYSYADVAYVGGGLATGLHNILEPATYGIPVIFGGNKYQKFQEAVDLLKLGGVTIVTDKKELNHNFANLKTNRSIRTTMGKTNANYIKTNTGATQKILKYVKNNL